MDRGRDCIAGIAEQAVDPPGPVGVIGLFREAIRLKDIPNLRPCADLLHLFDVATGKRL